MWKMGRAFQGHLHLLCSMVQDHADSPIPSSIFRKSYEMGYHYPIFTWKQWGEWLDNFPKAQELSRSTEHWDSSQVSLSLSFHAFFPDCCLCHSGRGVGKTRKIWKWGSLISTVTSLVAQRVKRLPTMRETWVQSLGWEDPLEKQMATYSSILAWKIPQTEEAGRLQSIGSQTLGFPLPDPNYKRWESAFLTPAQGLAITGSQQTLNGANENWAGKLQPGPGSRANTHTRGSFIFSKCSSFASSMRI